MKNKILSFLIILFGALSFLIFVPSIWWLGLAFAILAVVIGGAMLKTVHIFAVVGMLLAIVACAIYLFMMNAAGISVFS